MQRRVKVTKKQQHQLSWQVKIKETRTNANTTTTSSAKKEHAQSSKPSQKGERDAYAFKKFGCI